MMNENKETYVIRARLRKESYRNASDGMVTFKGSGHDMLFKANEMQLSGHYVWVSLYQVTEHWEEKPITPTALERANSVQGRLF